MGRKRKTYPKPAEPNLIELILLAIVLMVLTGCAGPRYSRSWGSGATLTPGWKRIGRAAKEAAFDSRTWIPLTGSVVFGFTRLDKSVSDWASETTPVFGSQKNARDASDDLRCFSKVCWITTALLAPSGDESETFLTAKLKGSMMEFISLSTTRTLTGVLKSTTRRERPNRRDDRSFPSGSTSNTVSYVCLAQMNLEWFEMNGTARKVLQHSLTTVSAGTGWARIEADVHYPSDVLFGAALGNFISVFFTRAFLGQGNMNPVGVGFSATPRGTVVCLHMVF